MAKLGQHEENVLNIWFYFGWRVNQWGNILFMSLITFTECCIYWSKAHKFSLSKLYRSHINVRAILLNLFCLISSSFPIRKQKYETHKIEKNLLFLSLPSAQAWLSFFSLSYSTCFSLWSLEIQLCSLAKGLPIPLNFQS